jgi:hypothetical protein
MHDSRLVSSVTGSASNKGVSGVPGSCSIVVLALVSPAEIGGPKVDEVFRACSKVGCDDRLWSREISSGSSTVDSTDWREFFLIRASSEALSLSRTSWATWLEASQMDEVGEPWRERTAG